MTKRIMLKNNKSILKYIQRNKLKNLIDTSPAKGLFNIVVIPVLDEPEILNTLNSLKQCALPENPVEVIIVINSKEGELLKRIEQNKKTYKQLQEYAKQYNNAKLSFYPLYFENLPQKQAGAGLARKIGMDQALLRFCALNKNGIITSLDADTEVSENYLIEIEKTFSDTKNKLACIYFEHSFSDNENTNISIAKYELYLRYYYQSLKYIKFPFACHTIGSAFAVMSDTYAKYGGMSPKQAGEDFYFIQKLLINNKFTEITNATVFPSSRISERVIFGTGPAVKQISETEDFNYFVYDVKSFVDIKTFLDNKHLLFKITDKEYNYFLKGMPESVSYFLVQTKFYDKLNKINKNTSNINSFVKAFYTVFDAFYLIRFLNETHNKSYYTKTEVNTVATQLLEILNINCSDNLYGLLKKYRKLEKKTLNNKK